MSKQAKAQTKKALIKEALEIIKPLDVLALDDEIELSTQDTELVDLIWDQAVTEQLEKTTKELN